MSTKSISLIAEVISKLTGLGLALSSLAYFVGYNFEKSYLSEAGASWALDYFSTADLIRVGQPLILIVASVLIFQLRDLIDKTTNFKKIKRYENFLIAITVLCMVASYISITIFHNYKVSYYLSIISGIVLLLAAGFTITSLIASLQKSKQELHGDHIEIIYFIYSFLFIFAPNIIGYSQAKLDFDHKNSKLPIAIIATSDTTDLKLIKIIGGKYLLVKLNPELNGREFYLTEISSNIKIINNI